MFGYGGLGPIEELAAAAFELGEATRNAAVSSSSIASRAARTQECTDARERLRAAASELARLVQAGSKSEEYREALARRETAERELLAELDSESGGRSRNFALDARSLSATLETGDALVAYRVYMRHDLELQDESEASGPRESTVESLCAFVVRPSRSEEATSPQSALHLIDLGPTAPIEAAVDAWREALGAVGERGRPVAAARPNATSLAELGSDLRRRVIDPLHEAIGPLERIVFVPDGPLQLVPLDALPSATARGPLVGDEWRVETRTTLGELLDAHATTEGPVELVAVGDVDFARVSDEGPGEEAKQLGTSVELADAGALERAKTASAPRDGDLAALFAPLPGSLREIDGLEERFKSSVGADAGFTRLAGKGASRAALLSAAPRARFLHIATHGWFAPDAMRTWRDREPLDAWSGLGLPQSGEQTVRVMSPMLLCGLALAGANLPEDTLGRAPGLVTADELSTLDLGNCELAVLSACDTARGDRRAAGQGIASLQKALQIAGARSVITSLWRVPDEATKDLMLEFYRRLWIEKQPKRKALWEAKRRLREAKDEHGNPKYALRDWAAWVLTGEPD